MHGAHEVGGMAPVAARVEVSQAQLRRESMFDASHGASDLPGDELESAARSFKVEQYSVAAEQTVGFTVVDREMETSHFADPIWTARVKRSSLILRGLPDLAKH